MISQSNVYLLFCWLRGSGKKAQEAIETGTGKISNVTQTFNYISAKGNFSGSQRNDGAEEGPNRSCPANQTKLKKALEVLQSPFLDIFPQERNIEH